MTFFVKKIATRIDFLPATTLMHLQPRIRMASDDELWDALEEEQGGEAAMFRGDLEGSKDGYPLRNPESFEMTNDQSF